MDGLARCPLPLLPSVAPGLLLCDACVEPSVSSVMLAAPACLRQARAYARNERGRAIKATDAAGGCLTDRTASLSHKPKKTMALYTNQRANMVPCFLGRHHSQAARPLLGDPLDRCSLFIRLRCSRPRGVLETGQARQNNALPASTSCARIGVLGRSTRRTPLHHRRLWSPLYRGALKKSIKTTSRRIDRLTYCVCACAEDGSPAASASLAASHRCCSWGQHAYS